MVIYCRLHVLWAVLILFLACRENGNDDPVDPVITGKFSNPLLAAAPDPWVEQKDDWYYVTHTTANNLRLYRTKKMSDVKNAEVKTVWSPPSTGPNSEEIWAPEIHFIDNAWYFYYAADDGNNDNHRIWVLQNTFADPFTGTWEDKGELELPDDKWAIDGTHFEHNGQQYFLWAGWEGDENVKQNIYIAKMSDPLTVVGERVMLSQPELSWELNGGTPTINEAPQFITHGDKVFIIYSASGCWTDDYALGMLTADATSDLMAAGSWSKSQTPVFSKNPSGLVYGPGHNSFFRSPDGTEDWIIYHANGAPSLGCGDDRSARMQKFTWKADGTPDFGVAAALGANLPIPSESN
jgi:GH43 family beta-xylosidase